jgi:hypothetical protein
MKNNNFAELRKRINKINEIHLEETAYLVKELGEFGVGSGFELGNIPFLKKAGTEREYKELALSESIHRFWSDAGKCYINRNFRACAIMLACLVEALICLELLRKKGHFLEDKTLGQLIGYCRDEKILTEILEELENINELRKIAVHLIYEKTKPKEIFRSGIFDEIVPIEKFKKPPAEVKRGKGWIETKGEGVELVIFPKPAIIYSYKKLAKIMYIYVQSIFKKLYNLKFKFSFKEEINL